MDFLLEDRIEFLKKQHAGGIDTSHDEYAIHRNPADIINHFATHADPSTNKQYTQWIINKYKERNFRQEDADRIRNALQNFHSYKHKLAEKDINKYPTLNDVEAAVTPHVGTAATKKEAVHHGLETLYDDGRSSVHRLKNFEASSAIYGGGAHSGKEFGTHWCTAANPDYFEQYASKGDLITIHKKNDKRSPYQYHEQSHQLMDRFDGSTQSSQITSDNPKLGKFLSERYIHFANDKDSLLKHLDNGSSENTLHVVRRMENPDPADLTYEDKSAIYDKVFSNLHAIAQHPNLSNNDASNARRTIARLVEAARQFKPHRIDKLVDIITERHKRLKSDDEIEFASTLAEYVPVRRYMSDFLTPEHVKKLYSVMNPSEFGRLLSRDRTKVDREGAHYQRAIINKMPEEDLHGYVSKAMDDHAKGRSVTFGVWDGVESVARAAKSGRVIDKFLEDPKMSFGRFEIYRNPHLTKDHLSTLAKHLVKTPGEYKTIQMRRLIDHPNFNPEHFDILLKGVVKNLSVTGGDADHPNKLLAPEKIHRSGFFVKPHHIDMLVDYNHQSQKREPARTLLELAQWSRGGLGRAQGEDTVQHIRNQLEQHLPNSNTLKHMGDQMNTLFDDLVRGLDPATKRMVDEIGSKHADPKVRSIFLRNTTSNDLQGRGTISSDYSDKAAIASNPHVPAGVRSNIIAHEPEKIIPHMLDHDEGRSSLSELLWSTAYVGDPKHKKRLTDHVVPYLIQASSDGSTLPQMHKERIKNILSRVGFPQ